MKHIFIYAYYTNLSKGIFILLFVTLTSSSNVVFSQDNDVKEEIKPGFSIEEENRSIASLDSLFNQTIKNNPEASLKYAIEMLQISEAYSNLNQQELASLNIASANYELRNFDSAYYYTERAMDLNRETNNEIALARAYYLKSDIYYYKGEHSKGIEYCFKAIDLYQKHNDTVKVARLHKEIAVLNREKGDYEMAMEYAIKSLTFFERQNDSLYIADAYRIIASVYKMTNSKEKLKENLDKAKSYLGNNQDTDLYRIISTELASYMQSQRKYNETLKIYYELIDNYLENKDFLRVANLYVNIGNTLMKMDSTDSALSVFRKAKSLYAELNLDKYVCHMEYTFGDVYYAIYNYDSAEYYLNKSYHYSQRINYSQIKKLSLYKLSLVYEETHNYKNAYKYYKKYKQYSDSISGEEIQLKIAELETKYETAKKDQQIIELEYQKEIQESWALTLKLIIAGVVIVFLLIIVGIWQKRKKDKLIQRQKDLVYRKEKQLAKSELEKSKLKEEELQQSILYKSKQLSTHALHMMQKNTMLQEIQSDIKNLSKKADTDDKPDFKRINLEINQSLRSDKDWDVFKLYFEDVNRNFYNRLNDINPELTTNDHRLCALIKLNMTSKEMASVLNVAPNSIKSSRYRLKKKLGLDVEADLEEFIRSLN